MAVVRYDWYTILTEIRTFVGNFPRPNIFTDAFSSKLDQLHVIMSRRSRCWTLLVILHFLRWFLLASIEPRRRKDAAMQLSPTCVRLRIGGTTYLPFVTFFRPWHPAQRTKPCRRMWMQWKKQINLDNSNTSSNYLYCRKTLQVSFVGEKTIMRIDLCVLSRP